MQHIFFPKGLANCRYGSWEVGKFEFEKLGATPRPLAELTQLHPSIWMGLPGQRGYCLLFGNYLARLNISTALTTFC